jgi:hypothetical protein
MWARLVFPSISGGPKWPAITFRSAQYGKAPVRQGEFSHGYIIPDEAAAFFAEQGKLSMLGKKLLQALIELDPMVRELYELTHPVPAPLRAYEAEDPTKYEAIHCFFTSVGADMRLRVIYSAATGKVVNSLMGHMGYLDSPSRVRKRSGETVDSVTSILDNRGVPSELGMAIVEAIREKMPELIDEGVREYERLREIVDPVGAF